MSKPDLDIPSRISLHKFLLQYGLSIIWGIVILILTGIPGQLIPAVPKFLDLFAPDKLIHLAIFGIFVFTLLLGFCRESNISFKTSGVYALLISITLGVITELLQVYIFINRQGSIYDFIADGTGSTIGYLLCTRSNWLNRFFKK